MAEAAAAVAHSHTRCTQYNNKHIITPNFFRLNADNQIPATKFHRCARPSSPLHLWVCDSERRLRDINKIFFLLCVCVSFRSTFGWAIWDTGHLASNSIIGIPFANAIRFRHQFHKWEHCSVKMFSLGCWARGWIEQHGSSRSKARIK